MSQSPLTPGYREEEDRDGKKLGREGKKCKKMRMGNNRGNKSGVWGALEMQGVIQLHLQSTDSVTTTKFKLEPLNLKTCLSV